MLSDASARKQAIDPHRSYIVQAPAGSGKTELLTQRFLALLSRVAKPEHIIALTFTRKAASEMKERIINALLKASSSMPNDVSAHEQLTQTLAQQALIQAKTHHWELLENPGRLKITTIDALCQTLAQSVPLLEKEIPFASIIEDPKPLYEQAAKECIAYATQSEHYQDSIKHLLMHLDNQTHLLVALLSDQLMNRDQWLHLLFKTKEQERSLFEKALENIEAQTIKQFKDSLSKEDWSALINLCQKLGPPLSDGQHIDDFSREQTQALCAILLTKEKKLRKQFDHHIGVKKENYSTNDYHFLKQESKELLQHLSEKPVFIQSLIKLSDLPPPYYTETQWRSVQALLAILPLLVAHLQVLFKTTNRVDFQAIAHQATLGLGQLDAPSDLFLYLDHSIHHLLIDEFQDTSIHQFQLIQQLAEGFSHHPHKTLFLVGDPMQSIYRFRGAEVGLFLQAKTEGIAGIPLIPLQLNANFRTNTTLLSWINQTFMKIFPIQENIELGAVSYHSAHAIHPSNPSSFLNAYACIDKAHEALLLCEHLQATLDAYPEDSIAILVRSRSQLIDIIKTLRSYQLKYQGIDIDQLSLLPHIQDLWSFVQALISPDDRLSYFAFLHSPWIGLSLSDLTALTESSTSLSADGNIRRLFAERLMAHAWNTRHQKPFMDWIIEHFDQLPKQHLLTPQQEKDIQQFFEHLYSHTAEEGWLIDPIIFEQKLNQLYSKSTQSARIQIMTIHKSKGLEFDSVFLPGLGSHTTSSHHPLFRWMHLPHPTQIKETLTLISPMKPLGEKTCPLYRYVNQLEQEKELYEQQRLFYVATTRAKKRLYLFDYHDQPKKNAFRSYLSEPVFEQSTPIHTQEITNTLTHTISFQQLPIEYYTNPCPIYTPSHTPSLTINEDDRLTRAIGIAAHRLLEWIGTYYPKKRTDIPWELAQRSLIAQGIEASAVSKPLDQIKAWINQCIESERGQWILSPHPHARSEYELLILEENKTKTIILDRVFYDQDILWIIDFKTGTMESIKSHQAQLNRYAHAFNQEQCIRCGLYYLPTQTWIAWDPHA